MANNFGKQFAINGFVDHNFGCMVANDMLFDSRGWVFGVKLFVLSQLRKCQHGSLVYSSKEGST